ncbi:MAG: thymidine kinase [Anaerovoracaceae bacterium]|nr:thymidine kinase [Anaerovoracaceae bacterium]
MAQLYYRYSTMNAGKSIELIKVAYNYEERGKNVLTLVPSVDDRYGIGVITSRIGVQREAMIVNDDTNILELYIRENEKRRIDCVLIDECQFLKKHHVQELVEIVDSCEVPVLAYGLKNDFRNELFEGSYYMLVYADKIEEIKTICWCGRKATMVARVVNGKMVKQGEQVVIGGNDMYVSLCRKHYNDGRFSENK